MNVEVNFSSQDSSGNADDQLIEFLKVDCLEENED